MTGPFESGSFVIPVGGKYSIAGEHPAQVIETFWMYRRTPDGRVIEDRSDMILAYKELDPHSWEAIGDGARAMTDEIWAAAISTKDHPEFIS